MATNRTSRPLIPLALLTLCLLFLSYSGFSGSVQLIADPSGRSMQMPQVVLNQLPVPDFFLPGLFLFFVYGLGSLVIVYGLWARPAWSWMDALSRRLHGHWSWLVALLVGVVLVVWVIVQLILIDEKAVPQLLMFLLGAAIVGLALLPALRAYYAET